MNQHLPVPQPQSSALALYSNTPLRIPSLFKPISIPSSLPHPSIGEKESAKATIQRKIWQQAHDNPDAIAVQDKSHSLSYLQLIALADSLADFLVDELDIHPGDRVFVHLPGSVARAVLVLALLRNHSVPILFDDGADKAPIDKVMKRSGAIASFNSRHAQGLPTEQASTGCISYVYSQSFEGKSSNTLETSAQNTTAGQVHGDLQVFQFCAGYLEMIFSSRTSPTPSQFSSFLSENSAWCLAPENPVALFALIRAPFEEEPTLAPHLHRDFLTTGLPVDLGHFT